MTGVDDDCRGAGGSFGFEEVRGVDAFFAIGLAGQIAEGVVGELADEAYLRSGTRRRDGLVGSFSAGTELESRSHVGFAPRGQLLCAEREIRNVTAHHHYVLLIHLYLSCYCACKIWLQTR